MQQRQAAATRTFTLVAAMLLTALPVAVLLADEKPGTEPALDEIVVVANKEARPLRDVAAKVSVVSREQLDAQLAVSLADLVRYAPGLDAESAGTRFGEEGISIRGIGGNRVAMVLDGVPLPDQFSVGSFSNATRDFLNAGLLQRVEVLHGPASALYGSAAIGGVVAATTPDPRQVTNGRRKGASIQALHLDGDASLHGVGLLGLRNGDRGIVLGTSLREGHELPSAAISSALDTRDYQRRAALAKLVIDDAPGGTLRLLAVFQSTEVQSDLRSLLGSGRYSSTTALRGDDDNSMHLLSAAWEFGDDSGWIDGGSLRAWRLEATTRQATLDERAAASRPVSIDRYFRFDQDLYGIELNLRRSFETAAISHRVGVGVELRERQSEEFRDGLETGLADGIITNVLLGEVFPLRDFPLSRTRELAAFVEDTMEYGRWALTAGLRADRYELQPLDDPMFAEDFPFATPVALSESDLSPKLALLFRASDRAELYLQYARGFRAPPYEEANIGLEVPLFNYRAIPNPDLRSENSDTMELGMRWQDERLKLHAAWFSSDYDDLIESRVRLGPDPDSGRILFQAQNIRSASISGVEAGFQLRFDGALMPLTLDASLYRATGRNHDNQQPLNSVGPAQAIVGVEWQTGEQQLRLQATATDQWRDRDETGGELFKPPGHVVMDAYYSRQFGERVTVRAGLRNIADRVYWHWSAVRGLSDEDPLITHLAQPGRNAMLGLHITW